MLQQSPLFLYFLLTGLAVGSYLNVVIHRLPRGLSTIMPVSRCPFCEHSVRLRDNIPLLSFLLLRGRCRDCSAPIGWQYPLIEATTGVLFAGAFLSFGPSWEAVIAALFGSLMIALAFIDAEHFVLPDRITLPGIIIGLALQPLIGWTSLTSAALGAAAGAGIILGMNGLWWLLRRVQGFGLGDVKMLAMIGAFLGLRGVALTLFISTLFGSLVGLALMVRGKIQMRSRLPFGVFLAIGAIVSLFFAPALFAWYLSFFP